MRFFLSVLTIVACFITLAVFCELYVYLRKKINRPKIGFGLSKNLISRNDYASINGKMYKFSHIAKPGEALDVLAFPSESNITIGGELAFEKGSGLGYVYIHSLSMTNCDFVYGKYGLKWARNHDVAKQAKERIENEG